MTEADLKQFLDENSDAIKETVKKATIDRLLEQYRWNITEQITVVVNDFVAAEIVPAVRLALVDNRGPIVEAAVKSIAGVGDQLAESLALSAAKNIKDAYRQREIAKAIFGY